MTLGNETVIEQCHEADDLPHLNISLIPLSDIANKEANDYVGESILKINIDSFLTLFNIANKILIDKKF
jgi:hypothetical protein